MNDIEKHFNLFGEYREIILKSTDEIEQFQNYIDCDLTSEMKMRNNMLIDSFSTVIVYTSQ